MMLLCLNTDMFKQHAGDQLPSRHIPTEGAAAHNATLHSLGVIGSLGAETQPQTVGDAGTAEQQIRAGVADFNQYGVSPRLEILSQGGVPPDALPLFAARLRDSSRQVVTLDHHPLADVARDFATHRVDAHRALLRARAERAASMTVGGVEPQPQSTPADRRHAVGTSSLVGSRIKSRSHTRAASDEPMAAPSSQPMANTTARQTDTSRETSFRSRDIDETVPLGDLVGAVAAWEVEKQPTVRVVRSVPASAYHSATTSSRARHRREDRPGTPPSTPHNAAASNEATVHLHTVPAGPQNTHPPRGGLRHFARRLREHLPSLRRPKGKHRAA